MGRMTAPIALPFIGVEDRARSRDVCRDHVVTGGCGCVIADPETALARVSRDDADEGRTIVGKGALPCPLVSPPSGRLRGVKMGRAFVPRRSGTMRPPRRRCRASHQSGRWRSGELGCAGDPAQQQHQRGRPLPRLFEDRARQQRVVAIARPTAVGREMALSTEQTPRSAAAAGACESLRRQVALEPDQAETIVQKFADRKIDHPSIIPRFARWLHMSRNGNPEKEEVNLSREDHIPDERCSEDQNRVLPGLYRLPCNVALGQCECVLLTMSSIGTGVRSSAGRATHNNR
jgi:hypothetical protein